MSFEPLYMGAERSGDVKNTEVSITKYAEARSRPV